MTTTTSSSIKQPNHKELDHSPSAVDWKQVLDLGYSSDGSTTTTTSRKGNVCFYCFAGGNNSNNNSSAAASVSVESSSSQQQQQQQRLLKCGRCHVATYCCKDCQIKDWKQGGHKKSCASYARVGSNMSITNQADQAAARNEILARIRYYAFPYAVHKAQTLGRGFLFVQSNHTLATMSLNNNNNNNSNNKPIVDSFGRVVSTNRSLLLYYLTVGEYDAEVCRDDFELTHVRTKLRQAVEDEYDKESQVVVLMRFRCGHLALGTAPLVPEYHVCKSLGREYYQNVSSGALELHLDDL